MLFSASRSSRPISYYIRVDYSTLRRRARQLDEHKRDFDWRFLAALVGKESGFSYRASNPSGAYGLFQLKPGTARMMGVVFEDMQRSVELQLRAGLNYLTYIHTEVLEKYAPELVERGGYDLYAVTYYAHNQGHGAARNILTKLRSRKQEPTWTAFRQLAASSAAEVAEEVAELADRFEEKYAELVEGRGPAFASTGMIWTDDTLARELRDRPQEDDGENLPIPPALEDHAPHTPVPTWQKILLITGITAFAAVGGYALWRETRPKGRKVARARK